MGREWWGQGAGVVGVGVVGVRVWWESGGRDDGSQWLVGVRVGV